MLFNIRGHEVHFPHQPYGVQFSFMEKMLRTLEEQGNALLEAPTGCGKTLSLLCAALAWQAKRKKELVEMAAAKLTRAGSGTGSRQPAEQRKGAAKARGTGAYGSADDSGEDAEDFKPNADVSPTRSDGKRNPGGSAASSPGESPSGQDRPWNNGLDDEYQIPPVPKIFFATRTHSQIAQVVRELKRTAYKPKMAILAAKQHYCINKAVIRSGRVDEECERLLKEEAHGCRFRAKPGAKTGRLPHVEVHDIEELSSACSKAKVCPYFLARDMALTAELIFCPYSYLLDPVVRAALGLDVGGSVLIFDEAHNMEDVCREGGSMDLDLDALREVEGAFRLAAQLTGRAELYQPLAEATTRLAVVLGRFEESPEGMTPSGFEEHEAVWQGSRALNMLDEAGLGPVALGELYRAYELAKAYEEKATFSTEGDAANEAIPASVTRPGAGGGALGTLGRLLTVLRLMYAPAPPPPAPPASAAAPPYPQLQPPQPTQPLNTQIGRAEGRGGQPSGMPYAHASAATAAAAAATGGGFIPSGGGGSGHTGPMPGRGGGGGAPSVPSSVVRDNSGDYRVVVKRWIAHGAKDRRKARSRLRKDAGDAEAVVGPGAAVSLGLWCLNPAVAFRHLADKAHSVVLTSGTLSPLDSFASELGTEFHVRLEAPHVVDMSRQVWAGVVPRGPGGASLSATYKESATFRFQDDAGEAVLRYCQVIPDGVLLFMPSYGLLDKLVTRWKSTGLWSRLEQVKTLVMEGREAGKGFEDAMARYYAAVRSGKGGLFMAVCRGKASEGIDFADQHARGVILMGIPFPTIKDTKVRLKKEYNDAGSGPASGRPLSQRLLNGDAWYSQQAFRALNQAVGRCIRHKYDWGAIILLDERFRGQGRQQQLSRWVRAAVKVHEDFDASIAQLTAFCKNLTADPPRPPPPAPPQPIDEAVKDSATALTAAACGAGAPASKAALRRAVGLKASAKGDKGMELQYEEDVVPPPDMMAAAGKGGAHGGPTGPSGERGGDGGGPFNRFRLAGPQPKQQQAANTGAGAGTSRLITAFFQPAVQASNGQESARCCGAAGPDAGSSLAPEAACCGGAGTSDPGGSNSINASAGPGGISTSAAAAAAAKPPFDNWRQQGPYGGPQVLFSQQATQQYQPRLPEQPPSAALCRPQPLPPSCHGPSAYAGSAQPQPQWVAPPQRGPPEWNPRQHNQQHSNQPQQLQLRPPQQQQLLPPQQQQVQHDQGDQHSNRQNNTANDAAHQDRWGSAYVQQRHQDQQPLQGQAWPPAHSGGMAPTPPPFAPGPDHHHNDPQQPQTRHHHQQYPQGPQPQHHQGPQQAQGERQQQQLSTPQHGQWRHPPAPAFGESLPGGGQIVDGGAGFGAGNAGAGLFTPPCGAALEHSLPPQRSGGATRQQAGPSRAYVSPGAGGESTQAWQSPEPQQWRPERTHQTKYWQSQIQQGQAQLQQQQHRWQQKQEEQPQVQPKQNWQNRAQHQQQHQQQLWQNHGSLPRQQQPQHQQWQAPSQPNPQQPQHQQQQWHGLHQPQQHQPWQGPAQPAQQQQQWQGQSQVAPPQQGQQQQQQQQQQQWQGPSQTPQRHQQQQPWQGTAQPRQQHPPQQQWQGPAQAPPQQQQEWTRPSQLSPQQTWQSPNPSPQQAPSSYTAAGGSEFHATARPQQRQNELPLCVSQPAGAVAWEQQQQQTNHQPQQGHGQQPPYGQEQMQHGQQAMPGGCGGAAAGPNAAGSSTQHQAPPCELLAGQMQATMTRQQPLPQAPRSAPAPEGPQQQGQVADGRQAAFGGSAPGQVPVWPLLQPQLPPRPSEPCVSSTAGHGNNGFGARMPMAQNGGAQGGGGGNISSCTGLVAGEGQNQRRVQGGRVGHVQGSKKRLTSSRAREVAEKRTRITQVDAPARGGLSNSADAGRAGNDFVDSDDGDDFIG